MKKWLLGKSLKELKEIAEDLSLPSFTAKQLAEWLYKKKASDIFQMTNLSKQAREALSVDYQVGGFAPLESRISVDGNKKISFSHTIRFNNRISNDTRKRTESNNLCIFSKRMQDGMQVLYDRQAWFPRKPQSRGDNFLNS